MTQDTWRRTLEYFASAYGDPGDIDPGALSDGSYLTVPPSVAG